MSETKSAKAVKPAVEKKEKPATPKKVASKDNSSLPYVAAVRVRGEINVNWDINDTLNMLNLFKRNFCSVYKATPSVLGMMRKCKDYITWGEVSADTLKELEKRAEVDPKDSKLKKKFYRLNSPKKGYGRKGIKVPFSTGGALGYRGDKINDLIKRMM
jgi:large subunit ribosomal protein L30